MRSRDKRQPFGQKDSVSRHKRKTHATSGYFVLADNTKFHPEDPDSLALLQALLEQYSTSEDNKQKKQARLCVAKAAEELKQYDLAFTFYDHAAKAHLKIVDYDYRNEATYSRKLLSLLKAGPRTRPNQRSNQNLKSIQYSLLNAEIRHIFD